MELLRLLSNLKLRIHPLDTWEAGRARGTSTRTVGSLNVHLLSGFWTLDFNFRDCDLAHPVSDHRLPA